MAAMTMAEQQRPAARANLAQIANGPEHRPMDTNVHDECVSFMQKKGNGAAGRWV
jgi:hypothetical protein